MSSVAMKNSPDPRAPGVGVGITDAMITRLVDEFYDRVRRDELLGPIFNASIVDWDLHLGRMRDFWSSVALMSGRYKGKPVAAHVKLPGIAQEHFTHWLALFSKTADDVCPAEAAALFTDRAERIADSLQLGIAFHRAAATSDRQVTVPAGHAKFEAPNNRRFLKKAQ